MQILMFEVYERPKRDSERENGHLIYYDGWPTIDCYCKMKYPVKVLPNTMPMSQLVISLANQLYHRISCNRNRIAS